MLFHIYIFTNSEFLTCIIHLLLNIAPLLRSLHHLSSRDLLFLHYQVKNIIFTCYRELKFLSLLTSALNCLGTICEMMTFIQLKPLLEEIILYVKVWRLGWLKMDMLSKVHSPPQNEIAPALELFEGIVNTLLHVYGAFQSIECKQAVCLYTIFISAILSKICFILRVMCELLRGGIIYTMADPKKILFEAVMVQLHDPSSGNKELLREVLYVAIELLNHIDNNNAIEGECNIYLFSFFRLILNKDVKFKKIYILLSTSGYTVKRNADVLKRSRKALMNFLVTARGIRVMDDLAS
uniref:DUF4704 domain-containing protein n=1 Tax=Heterorhabditis bacteriophora TaxID=37862 RepID=A0A1I7WAI5_HETBA